VVGLPAAAFYNWRTDLELGEKVMLPTCIEANRLLESEWLFVSKDTIINASPLSSHFTS